MDMKNHRQHVEREGITRRDFLRGLGVIGGTGAVAYFGIKYGKSTYGNAVDALFPESHGDLQTMPYKVGDVIKGRKIMSPAVVAEIVSENPIMAESGKAANPAYLTQLMEDFPENVRYKGRWNKLQFNDEFTGIDWKQPYKK